jgi:MFS family permease
LTVNPSYLYYHMKAKNVGLTLMDTQHLENGGKSMSDTTLEPVNQQSNADGTLTKYQWRTLWASTVGYAMDGLDLMILSYVLSFIIADLSLNSAQAGLIATVTLLGAVVGGYVFGILADKYGRVKIFSLSILIFSIFTGLTAFVDNIVWFNVMRFIAGLGLGGEFGIGMTLVVEVWPKKYRSRATGVVAAGFQVGMVVALLCSLVFVPMFGWQSAFIIGALPALFAWWSRRKLAEPEIWVQSKANRSKDAKFPLTYLFNSPKTVRTTIGLIIITSVQTA